MSRKPRAEVPGAIHHVVSKGNGGQVIVQDDRDRSQLLARLGQTIERCRWSCLAYCLLNNHIHLVVETPEPNLGVGMKWLKATYAQDFNYRHSRTGHLFGGRFYSEIISRENHLVSAVVYVLLNPVRAGMVSHPQDWPWCSYPATLGVTSAPPWLDVGTVLALAHEDAEVARRLLADALSDGIVADGLGSDPWGLTPG